MTEIHSFVIREMWTVAFRWLECEILLTSFNFYHLLSCQKKGCQVFQCFRHFSSECCETAKNLRLCLYILRRFTVSSGFDMDACFACKRVKLAQLEGLTKSFDRNEKRRPRWSCSGAGCRGWSVGWFESETRNRIHVKFMNPLYVNISSHLGISNIDANVHPVATCWFGAWRAIDLWIKCQCNNSYVDIAA